MKKKIIIRSLYLMTIFTMHINAGLDTVYFNQNNIKSIHNNSSGYQPNQELQSFIKVDKASNLPCGGNNPTKVLFIKNDSSGDRILYLITLAKMYGKEIKIGVKYDKEKVSKYCFLSHVEISGF